LVFIHGGGWTNGYKEWVGLLAPSVVAFPAVFVSVACRLAPDHRLPVPFDDCASAIRPTHSL
ncbi:MAG: alpha/beta hydrolase fold domain-containing protein, partial [Bauldia litoralis]